MSQGGTGSGIVEGQFYMYGGAAGGVQIVSNTPINADQWYHICIVVDQTGTSVVEFYIDGQLDKTTNSWTGGIEPEDIGQISTIGSNKSGANQWEFDGTRIPVPTLVPSIQPPFVCLNFAVARMRDVCDGNLCCDRPVPHRYVRCP